MSTEPLTAAGATTTAHQVPSVVAVHSNPQHTFSKQAHRSIQLEEGLGVVGDAHHGATVQHRSRVARDPSQPNLRQVHLIQRELFETLAGHGHHVEPGDLGENVTTTGVDLLGLPVGTRLRLGGHAVVILTGLRNPCHQINDFSPGLLKHLVRVGSDGTTRRLAGVMGIVARSGAVTPGDPIEVTLPPLPHHGLTRV